MAKKTNVYKSGIDREEKQRDKLTIFLFVMSVSIFAIPRHKFSIQ